MIPWASLSLWAALAAGCATVQIQTDYDQEAHFSRYATFAYMGEDARPLKRLEHQGPATRSLVQKRLKRATSEALTSKGFSQVDRSRADLLVAFHLSVRHQVDVTDLPYRTPQRWGYRTHVTHYDVGTLVIDLIDRRAHQLVWRGTASGVMNKSNLSRREHIDKSIAQIMALFPPG